MTKLGIFVGEDIWMFFEEIFADLATNYDTEIYKRKVYNTPILYGRLNRWSFREGIQSMLRRNDICFFEWASELLAAASHMPKQCAIITRLHSFELYEWAPQINWEAVDKIILVSRAMQKMFNDLYPDHSHKTTVIYNGRSLELFRPPDQRTFNFNLGMLCNISPIKRVYEVILMFYNLRQQGYKAHLFIAGKPGKGDFRYTAAVYHLVEKLGLQNDVIFEGHVTDTPAWLQKIDILISNSFWEGQQVALLEGMASGCYCLSHFWAGAEEMLPPENLYITDVELQQKIIEYAEKPEVEKQHYQAQLRSIALEKFNIEKTKTQIIQVTKEIAECRINKWPQAVKVTV